MMSRKRPQTDPSTPERRADRELEVLREASTLFQGEHSPAPIFGRVCALLTRFFDASVVFIAFRKPEGNVSIDFLFSSSAPEECAGIAVARDSCAFEVLRTGHSVLKRSRSDWTGSIMPIEEGVSAMFVPLRLGSEVTGVLSLQSPRERAYVDDDVLLLEKAVLYISVAFDNARLAFDKERFKQLATIDSLTNLANRRAFDECLAVEWERAARNGSPLSVILVDIDFFKEFNDRYGHIAGDACLQQVSRTLEQCFLSTNDFIARYGGEEFAAVLAGNAEDDAIRLAEKMRSAVERLAVPHRSSNVDMLTVSIGVASVIPRPDRNPLSLVAQADRALYRAKSRGRNRVVGTVYSSPARWIERQKHVPNNLPHQVTTFLGREIELASLGDALRSQRLTTLVGPGGVGKSRLALQAASAAFSEFPAGIWFVELASITGDKMILQRIARSVGVDSDPENTLLERLTTALAHVRALFVMSNCEHVIDEAAQVIGRVLRACDNVAFLATSREPLHVFGESVLRLSPLSAPQSGLSIGVASKNDAIRFFVERARTQTQDFRLTTENVDSVASICRRLDGLPLALELGAARLGNLSVEQLAEQLTLRLDALVTDAADREPRQRSLNALVAWSFDFLSSDEKKTLQAVTPFAGGFTLESAEAVCSSDGVEIERIVTLVCALVDKSLLAIEEKGAVKRYRLLETIREFARSTIDPVREVSLREAHMRYFEQLASRAVPHLYEPAAVQWRGRLSQESDNFREALAFAVSREDLRGCAVRLVSSLARYWHGEQNLHEVSYWLDQIPQNAVEHSAALASALRWRAFSELLDGNMQSAKRIAESALRIARDVCDESAIADCAETFALAASGLHLHEEARLHYDEARMTYRRLNNQVGVARTYVNEALNALLAEDAPNAERCASEALALFRTLQMEGHVAQALHVLAWSELIQGDAQAAALLCEQAFSIVQMVGDPFGICNVAHSMAFIALQQGDFQRARELATRVLESERSSGNWADVRSLLRIFCAIAEGTGRSIEAARLFGATVSLGTSSSDPDVWISTWWKKEWGQALECRLAAELGDGRFATERSCGEALSVDEAVKLACSI